MTNPLQVRPPSVTFLSWVFVPLLLTVLFTPSATAGTNLNGALYWANITPQNDIYELSVNPGDTLLQGRSYDLMNVYGFSGTFAHWNDWKTEYENCNPDIIINTSYIKTNGRVNPKNVYLDPSMWATGDWFQWDGCFDRYEKGQTEANYVPYSNDNAKMFKIINYSTDYQILKNWQAEQDSASGIRGATGNTDLAIQPNQTLTPSGIRGI